MKPWKIALAYIAFSVLALALFATPLWYAWRVNVGTLRVFVPEDLRALTDLFHRKGADAVAAAVRSRADASGPEVIVFAGPGKEVLAGTLRRWPSEIPDAPGTYGHVIDRGDGSFMRIVVTHEFLPGGYQLIMGRQSAGLMSLEGYFWYGMTGAMAIVLSLGGALAWLLARRAHAARLSEERYKRALHATNDGIWEWNPATDEIFLSERALHLWAVPDGVPIRTWADLKRAGGFHPEEFQRAEDVIEARVPSEGSFDVEYRVVHSDGQVRWVRSQGRVFPGLDDRPMLVTGSATDITERKLAEEALRESEERYEVAMAASESGYWDWHIPSGRYFLSPKAYELGGYPSGTTWADRDEFKARINMHPEDFAKWDAAREELFAGMGERLAMEVRYIVGGVTRWHALRAICRRDDAGNVVRWTGSATDITERKRAEEALRRSEERYALAVAGSNDGIWDWDLTTQKMFVSERAQRIFGLEPGATERLRDEWHAMIAFHPDDHRAQQRMVKDYLSGAIPNNEGEWRVRGGKGGYRWIRIRSICLRNAAGEPVRMAGSVSDIDAQKTAEQALRESEQRYALAVAGSDDGVWDVDFVNKRVFISERARVLAAMPPGPEIVPMEEWFASLPLHPEDAPRRAEAFAEHVAGKTPAYVGEFRLRQSDGTYRWRRLRGLCLRDADGQPYRMAGSISDIDARRRAEDDLRESESRFRSLTQISSDWYWRQDENLRFTYLSEGVSDRAGWPGEDYIGRLRWEVPGIHLISCSWEEHKEVLAKRLPFRDLEYWRPGEDGAVYSSISGTPIFDEQGRFKGYQGVGRNITERKRVEDALRLSEARYARAMDASADGLWEWRAATDELYMSPRARELWGIPDGVEIRTRAELKAQKLQFTEDTICECIAQRSGVEMTYSVLNQAGELRWIRSMGKVFLDEHGEPMLVTGSLTDATEGKLAADALRRSEEELRARQDMLDLAQKAASAVAFEWHVGPGEGENGWSPDLEIMYGLEPGSYNGTFESWKKLVFPEDWPAVKAAIERANETGDVAAEYRVVHPGGTVRWLQAKGRMFFDDERKPARVVGFMLDVTDRHQAEEELRRLERQLRQAQRLEAMGTLAGGIAHDFNNILGAILGYGEMAMRDAPKASRLARDLDSIIVAGERGRALVDRVLAFSRSGVGERVPVHVEKVVREALDLIRAKLPRNVALQAKLRAGRAAMLGDATQVHQVVMNLATNAVQAMQAGGRLCVSLTPVRLETARAPTIGIIDPGEYLVLEVADSGAGIAPVDLEHIFDPFFTTKEVGTGTGLGLSLVHGIVVELGGGIDVASTLGAGSTFTVYLPRSGETVEAPQDEEPEMPRGDGQRVLVVDDEEPLVRLATRTLEELGYAPVGFTSSSAALAAFRADPQHFDALITDERMPGLSGSALIREVRGIRSSLPVVLMSGYLNARAGKTRENSLTGAPGRASKVVVAIAPDEVLQKPLSARDLATSLAKVLRL